MRVLVVSAQESFRSVVQAACLRFRDAMISLRLADTAGSSNWR